MLALNRLRCEIQAYVDLHHKFPGGNLKAAIPELLADGAKFNRRPFEMITAGRDAWNSAFVYEYTEPGTLVLRSLGTNRIDENGKGDDIQLTVHLESD